MSEKLEMADWRQECLIPDLAPGLPTSSDRLQARLAQIMQAQTAAFEAVVREMSGEASSTDLAAFIVAAWHGTLLCMKAEGNSNPIDRFRRILAHVTQSCVIA